MAMGGLRWPERGSHKIYQDSGQGREFKRGLVEGQLTAEDISTIPECFHSVLNYMERKRAESGEMIRAAGYKLIPWAGLMQPISTSAVTGGYSSGQEQGQERGEGNRSCMQL